VPFDGQVLAPVLIIFLVVGILALTLRWTFGRDPRSPIPAWPEAEDGVQPADDPARDDFGLLAAAATVGSEQEARRIRDILGIAGIKATTTVDRSGHWKVLVFATELHRARRVAGGSS
jgi:hypothetical protein